MIHVKGNSLSYRVLFEKGANLCIILYIILYVCDSSSSGWEQSQQDNLGSPTDGTAYGSQERIPGQQLYNYYSDSCIRNILQII